MDMIDAGPESSVPGEMVQTACLAYGGGAFPQRMRRALAAALEWQAQHGTGTADAPSDTAQTVPQGRGEIEATLTYRYATNADDYAPQGDRLTAEEMALFDIEVDSAIILNSDWKLGEVRFIPGAGRPAPH